MSISLEVYKRDKTGKSSARKLRAEGKIPAVVYGRGEQTEKLLVNRRNFVVALAKLKDATLVIELKRDWAKPLRCILKSMQRDPITQKLLHIDFQQIHAREKIVVNVPVALRGTAIGLEAGGILDQHLREIQVRAEVSKIPSHIEVDVSQLGLGHSIHISDLHLDEIEVLIPKDVTIVSVLAPRKEEEKVVTEAVEGVVEGAEAEGMVPETEESEAQKSLRK